MHLLFILSCFTVQCSFMPIFVKHFMHMLVICGDHFLPLWPLCCIEYGTCAYIIKPASFFLSSKHCTKWIYNFSLWLLMQNKCITEDRIYITQFIISFSNQFLLAQMGNLRIFYWHMCQYCKKSIGQHFGVLNLEHRLYLQVFSGPGCFLI